MSIHPSTTTPTRVGTVNRSAFTSPRRRPGLRRLHSDAYRRMAITRSASKLLSNKYVLLKKAPFKVTKKAMFQPVLCHSVKKDDSKKQLDIKLDIPSSHLDSPLKTVFLIYSNLYLNF